MSQFEYHITKHPFDEFRQLAYFCTDQGECKLEEVPGDEFRHLDGILNEKGAGGWELVQILIGRDGMVAFWKRAM
ncbi:MAG: hypothetical protein JW821_20265 [Deltaproteobacteria bacterium]|nr:hypothetical protein [Deltaproteobacteria bacterium]